MKLSLLASFGEVMSYIGYGLLAVLVLLVMITVHELGHYIAGKIFGFGITEFSIGFGPALIKKKRKSGEIFSVRAIPLGGFCSFTGENEKSDDPSAFNNKAPFKRIIVLISGALMNYLLALLIIAVSFAVYGRQAYCAYDMIDNPAYIGYSFEKGDVILEAEGKEIYLSSDFMSALSGKKQGQTAEFKVIRAGKTQNIEVKLREDAEFQSVEDVEKVCAVLGIDYLKDGDTVVKGFRSVNVRYGFFETIGKTFAYSVKLAGSVFAVLGQLITGRLALSAVGGTVTTIAVTVNAVKVGGLSYLLSVAALIGVNLAVFNLLPIPALDGARVVFTLIEWIFKKPVNRKVEAIIHGVGFVMILLFAIIVDLQHCF